MNVQWLRGSIDRKNNFDLIRLFAAVQVVIYHGVRHMGVPIPDVLRSILASFPGVPIFFFLSGMLVTFSLSMTPDRRKFYEKRLRRIYPGLLFAFVLAIIMLVGFHQVTSAELGRPGFWAWVVGQTTIVQFWNPPFFRDFATGVVNGSLWTISIEVSFYAILPFLAAWAAGKADAVDTAQARRRLSIITGIAVALSYALYLYIESFGDDAPMRIKILHQTFLPHLWLFGLGILAFLYFDRLREFVQGKVFLLLALSLAANFTVQHFAFPGEFALSFVGTILLCLATLAVAVATKPVAAQVLRGWDMSYGIYLYHMIAMNSFVALGWKGSWIHLLGVLGITACVATFSWKFIEHPVMRGKRVDKPEAVAHVA